MSDTVGNGPKSSISQELSFEPTPIRRALIHFWGKGPSDMINLKILLLYTVALALLTGGFWGTLDFIVIVFMME